MSLSLPATPRDLTLSAFPLQPQWGLPWRPWYAHYPSGVPRGLTYTPTRAERLLLCAADRYANRRAIWYYHTTWTYTELCQRIRQVAANLARLGVRTGDRVVMALPNSPEFVVGWFALHWLGAQVVPANPLCSTHDLAHLVDITGARVVMALDLRIGPSVELTHARSISRLIVVSLASHLPARLAWPYRIKNWLSGRIRAGGDTRVHRFEELYQTRCASIREPVLTDASLPAVLQPTGGTTGTPKVAILTHHNMMANVAQLHVWSGMKPGEETLLAVLPFFHVFGSTISLLSALAGGATLLLQARFHPPSVLHVLETQRPTVAPMVPMMFASLNDEMRKRGRDVNGLRICLSGASALANDVRLEFERRTGAIVFEGYGLSEASPVTHGNPPDTTARHGTIGLPFPDTIARIMDVETGTQELPPGKVGELVVRGPQVMSGYLNAPDETRHMLRDGWLFTGDLASMSEDGYFTLVDRKKDLIKSGGLNVFPSEVERVLASHPSVKECAVVGAPDKLFGEQVVGYVVPRERTHVMPDQLKVHCKKQLASYKVPRVIKVCDELPTTFLGKVRRVDLREQAAGNGRGEPHVRDRATAVKGKVEEECPKP
jgi:long-chain acyl-CoA synthetase